MTISSIRIDQNVPMQTRDGVVLMSDIYRPGGKGKYPAIIMRTPYAGENIIGGHGYTKLLPTVRAGYALVIAYVRGRFGSGGKYDLAAPQSVEGGDCFDTVEWAASQPWCDGNIGMAGESALGTVQWRTARENPPHLKAIAPAVAGAPGEVGLEVSDPVFNLNIGISLTTILAPDIFQKLEEKGQDVSEARRMLESVLADPSLAYNFLPLKDIPQFNYPGIREIWQNCLHLSDPKPDASLSYPFEKVQVPGLCISSWYDPFSRGSFHSFINLRKRAGSRFAREHQHLYVGPYSHFGPTRVLGQIDFGSQSDADGSRASGFQISFFDQYLKGQKVKLPTVRYFTIGRNCWQDADDWPLPQTDWQRFYLHSQSGANSSTGDGLLSRQEPGQESPDSYLYDPLNPVPTAGGRGGIAENGFIYGPVDQIYIERRNDVLCYSTPVLENDVEVTGPLELHLFASTTGRDTDFTAKLVDVYPDGRAFNAADGIIRARFRKSLTKPELLAPNEIYDFIIRLGPTSQLFRRGHRIRIDIASSNFPNYDRNMNTGRGIGEDAQGIPAQQTIFHQSGFASYIDLPVIPTK
jgi:uncharacterized protein